MICHACVYIIDPLVYLSTIEIAYFIHLSFLILFFIEFRQLYKQAPLQNADNNFPNCFFLQATEDRYNNKGAYVVLEPPNFDNPIFRGFSAVTPRPKANPFYDYQEVIDSDEELDLASMVTT